MTRSCHNGAQGSCSICTAESHDAVFAASLEGMLWPAGEVPCLPMLTGLRLPLLSRTTHVEVPPQLSVAT